MSREKRHAKTGKKKRTEGFQRCRWDECQVTASIDGLCAFHYDCSRIPQLNTREGYSDWRDARLEAGDMRWALYSASDGWARLNGETRPDPRCMSCREPLADQRVFSVRDIHRDGTATCLRCGPHPRVIEEWSDTEVKERVG